MTRRRYPPGLTEAQKKMMRQVELGRFEPTPRQQARLNKLVARGLLVPTDDWYEHAEDLLPLVTYFIEEDYGSIKIGVAASTQIIDRLQLSHPRPLKLIGAIEGDHTFEVQRTCKKHHIKNGWYKPHADVLAWTKRKDFKRP
jgi:hypothetical protein